MIKINRPIWIALNMAYMFLLTHFSLQGSSGTQEHSAFQQMAYNAIHVPAYAVFAYLWVCTLGKTNNQTLFWVFFISVSYGILMEIGQSFIPGREASLSDAMLNALGAGVVIFIVKRNQVRTMVRVL